VFNLLCEALQVTAPSLKKAVADNPYCFEADVLDGKAARRKDVYKRGHFSFESKQGIAPWDPAAKEASQTSTKGHSMNPKGAGVRATSAWRDAMSSGRVQVGRYAVAVTKWPADLPGQIGAVLAAMTAVGEDVTADAVAEGFSGATTEGVATVLECLQVAQRVVRVVEDDGSERWVLRT
jgi:hypothetical protein